MGCPDPDKPPCASHRVNVPPGFLKRMVLVAGGQRGPSILSCGARDGGGQHPLRLGGSDRVSRERRIERITCDYRLFGC